jgi:GNAT superfamily N-acetyltransferase
MSPDQAKGDLALTRGIRLARDEDVAPLTTMLTEAFAADPVHRWLLPTERERRWGSRRAFEAILRQGLRHGIILRTDDASGAALWVPPAPGAETALQTVGFYARMAAATIRRPLRAARIGSVLDGLRPPAPHWYLFVLGVHPAHQGRGLSAALMDPVLALCDTTCTPAYLESSNEKNLPVYGRRGFQVRREVPLGAHGPSLWPMDRPPRG